MGIFWVTCFFNLAAHIQHSYHVLQISAAVGESRSEHELQEKLIGVLRRPKLRDG